MQKPLMLLRPFMLTSLVLKYLPFVHLLFTTAFFLFLDDVRSCFILSVIYA